MTLGIVLVCILSAPLAPTPDELLKTVNASSVELDMRAWRREVCGIHFYSVRYQVQGETVWTEANNHVNWNTVRRVQFIKDWKTVLHT